MIDQGLMNEEQFQRVVFGSQELHISIEQNKIQRPKGFRFLSEKVHERTKKGKFKIDYIVPDLWRDPRKFVVVDEDEHNLLHSVAIPQLDKVLFFAK